MTIACRSEKIGVSAIASRNRHDSDVQCGEPARGKKLRDDQADCGSVSDVNEKRLYSSQKYDWPAELDSRMQRL